MGRRPDPEYVRAMKGKKPRVKPEDQVRFNEDRPLPPDWLGKEALKCWDRMAAELEKAGILVAITRDKLARYCQAWADWEEINKMRAKEGLNRLRLVKKNTGNQYFWAQTIKQCESTMCSFEAEYGLTPASAVKVRRPLGPKGKGVLTPGEQLENFLEEGEESA